jgi:hypothetical protein
VNATNGRVISAAGAALVIVAIFLNAFFGQSYWDIDGTLAWFGLILAAIALLLCAAGYAGQAFDGWTFGIGALLIGYYGWFPALTAFDDWKHTGAGLWLALAGAIIIAFGAVITLTATGGVTSTPAGASPPALAVAIGIVLCIVSIFLDADHGEKYWSASGHSLGIVMLAFGVLAGLAWIATVQGRPTFGIDLALTLILLGLFALDPVGSAFNQFGDLDAGAWLGLAGGILAAGGTWATRGAELSHTATAAA